MDIHPWVWYVTVAVMVAVLAVDVFVIGRRPHEPSMKECGIAVGFFISLALLFGLGVFYFSGGDFALQFYVGWLTEYSLSVDNLFVFIIIMSKFSVPRQYQQTALLIGIILALVFRGIFIALGAAAISQFAWIFYVFGAFLIYTAIKLASEGIAHEEEEAENAVVRWSKKHLAATDKWNGIKMTVRENGKRLITPMALVVVALGTTDLMFALDSIPAIFGITQEPYLVFTANVFALMGLRQLYFLLGGLLTRLVYLSYGLAVVLGFIGVKLIMHAIHENTLPFINEGKHVDAVPEISTGLSLGVIVLTLAVTTFASLWKTRKDNNAGPPREGNETNSDSVTR